MEATMKNPQNRSTTNQSNQAINIQT